MHRHLIFPACLLQGPPVILLLSLSTSGCLAWMFAEAARSYAHVRVLSQQLIDLHSRNRNWEPRHVFFKPRPRLLLMRAFQSIACLMLANHSYSSCLTAPFTHGLPPPTARFLKHNCTGARLFNWLFAATADSAVSPLTLQRSCDHCLCHLLTSCDQCLLQRF